VSKLIQNNGAHEHSNELLLYILFKMKVFAKKYNEIQDRVTYQNFETPFWAENNNATPIEFR